MFDLEIQALGLRCPLPVLRLNHRIKGLDSGSRVKLICDDVSSLSDVPMFCESNGHQIEQVKKEETRNASGGSCIYHFSIIKGHK
tara:strand:+ start:72 stop:326 length:255 start_codon:yes stop_codon:yes gene_type:complete